MLIHWATSPNFESDNDLTVLLLHATRLILQPVPGQESILYCGSVAKFHTQPEKKILHSDQMNRRLKL